MQILLILDENKVTKPQNILLKLYGISLLDLFNFKDESYDKFIDDIIETANNVGNVFNVIYDRKYFDELQYFGKDIIINLPLGNHAVKYFEKIRLHNENGFTNGSILYGFANKNPFKNIDEIGELFGNSIFFGGMTLESDNEYYVDLYDE